MDTHSPTTHLPTPCHPLTPIQDTTDERQRRKERNKEHARANRIRKAVQMESLFSQLAASEVARRGLVAELEAVRGRERELELRVLTVQDDAHALVDQVGGRGVGRVVGWVPGGRVAGVAYKFEQVGLQG